MSASHATLAPTPQAARALRWPAPALNGLSNTLRRAVIGAIALAHVGAIWGVLQVPAVRQAVMVSAPVFVELLAAPAPTAPPQPPVQPVVKVPPPVVIATPAAAPSPSPAAFEVAPPREVPTPLERPVTATQIVEAAPPPPPKTIPASAVQYLDAVPPEYPRTSRRLNEAGTVTLRIYIDERGLPATVQVSQSSGYSRLDESALAAVQKWRFKPYSENGQPTAGYAVIPVMFELEK